MYLHILTYIDHYDTHTHIHKYTHTHPHTHTHTHTLTHTHPHTHTHTHTRTHTHSHTEPSSHMMQPTVSCSRGPRCRTTWQSSGLSSTSSSPTSLTTSTGEPSTLYCDTSKLWEHRNYPLFIQVSFIQR